MVLINNSCYASVRGTVNGDDEITFNLNWLSDVLAPGIAQTMASGARVIGPTLGGYIYAWSQSNGAHRHV